MHVALRLIPGRRQVPGLTSTTIDAMPEYDPTWDREHIPEFAQGTPFPGEQWGSRSFTRPAVQQASRESPATSSPRISESVLETPTREEEEDIENTAIPQPLDHASTTFRRLPPTPFASLEVAHLNLVQQATVATACRQLG
jgi:hypothetical protein